MTPLTVQQEKVWLYLSQCNRCPSYKEIARDCGLKSTSSVHRYITALEAKGYVSHAGSVGRQRMARSLIVNDGPKAEKPPLSCYSFEELKSEIDRRTGELTDLRERICA